MSKPIPIPCSTKKNKKDDTENNSNLTFLTGFDSFFPPPSSNSPPKHNISLSSFENKITHKMYQSSPSQYSSYIPNKYSY